MVEAMNEWTAAIVVDCWKNHPRKDIGRFRRDVRLEYWAVTGQEIGVKFVERAMHLARLLWSTPECFDQDNLCDHCVAVLTQFISDGFYARWLAKHPEFQLSEFDENDLQELGIYQLSDVQPKLI